MSRVPPTFFFVFFLNEILDTRCSKYGTEKKESLNVKTGIPKGLRSMIKYELKKRKKKNKKREAV